LPKPTAIRELEGDPGKLLRKRRREPKPRLATGAECPGWLGKFAATEWRRIVPELERLGLLTVVDLGALEVYCDLYGQWRVARTKRDDLEPSRRIAGLLRQYLAEFGLSPAARVRLEVDDPTPTPPTKPPTGGTVTDLTRFFEGR